MTRKQYTAQFKTKVVLEVLQGDKDLGTIAYENNLNANMLRRWKNEFLENASMVFEDPARAEKNAKREEENLKKEKARMLKTIGQLTLERDFLQDCFREAGVPVPDIDQKGQ